MLRPSAWEDKDNWTVEVDATNSLRKLHWIGSWGMAPSRFDDGKSPTRVWSTALVDLIEHTFTHRQSWYLGRQRSETRHGKCPNNCKLGIMCLRSGACTAAALHMAFQNYVWVRSTKPKWGNTRKNFLTFFNWDQRGCFMGNLKRETRPLDVWIWIPEVDVWQHCSSV